MNYEEVKSKVFAHGSIPDGYFGDRAEVGFTLVGNRIIVVAYCGCFNAGLPDVANIDEAFQILRHYPIYQR